MSNKIVVPEGMLKAVDAAWINAHGGPHPQASPKVAKDIEDGIRFDLEAALRWLSENPIVPTMQELVSMQEAYCRQQMSGEHNSMVFVAVEWQRRMFLAPEPEVPEEIKDLFVGQETLDNKGTEMNHRIHEAYRRGQKAGMK